MISVVLVTVLLEWAVQSPCRCYSTRNIHSVAMVFPCPLPGVVCNLISNLICVLVLSKWDTTLLALFWLYIVLQTETTHNTTIQCCTLFPVVVTKYL